MIKNLPAVQETGVRSLGWEDPLEKGVATHSSILAWRIPWTEEPGRLQSTESQRVGHDWSNFARTCRHSYGEPQGSSGCKRITGYRPGVGWGVYERNDFSEPGLLYLPIHRKALNSLTWFICFSLINNNLLMFSLSALCYKTSIKPGSSPLPPLSSSLRVNWDAVSWLEVLKNSHWIKHSSQLLGCEYFLSWYLCQLQMGTCQDHCQCMNNKGICHLPLQRLNPVLL